MFQFQRQAHLSADELSRASCREVDPELFFPQKGGSTKKAKQVCLACDVRQSCLIVALANDEAWGIFGGLSERERRKLKKKGHL